MLPRGEGALIIAGIGLTAGKDGEGVFARDIFGVAIVMTIFTTVLAPVPLVPAFRSLSHKSPELWCKDILRLEPNSN